MYVTPDFTQVKLLNMIIKTSINKTITGIICMCYLVGVGLDNNMFCVLQIGK